MSIIPHFYFFTRTDDIKLNKFKIGETIEQDVAERVKQQEGGSAHSDKLIWESDMKFNATDFIKKSQEKFPQKKKNFDDELRNLLISLNENDIKKVEDSAGREWCQFVCFEGKNLSDNEKKKEVLKYIQTAINQYVKGIARSNTFLPRPDQQRCIDIVTSHYNNFPEQPFLMNCKMRFGKCFTTYQIAKKLKCKKVLIGTYWPSVKESWKEDLINHVDFAGYSFHEISEDASIYDDDKNQVFFMSFQGAIANDKKEIDLQTRGWIYEKNWDLFVFDEEHYGKNTDECDSILNKLRVQFKLYLSGTPYKDLMSGDFLSNQIFSWTYEDEQLAKKEWNNHNIKNPYENLPALKFFAINIEKYLIDQSSKYFSENEGFTLTKLFATKNGKFIEKALVKRFLNLISEDCNSIELIKEIHENAAYKFTEHEIRECITNCSPWSFNDENLDELNLKHTLWKLPSIEACKALKIEMEKHPCFEPRLKKIIIAANHIDIKDIEELRKEIKKNVSTITLTVDAFTVGTTVPEWGAVFMLDDGKSVTDYFQTIFRCQTPYKNKKFGYIFDYNPQRLIKMSYDYNLNNSKGTKDFEKRFEIWLDCAPIFEINKKNQWKQLNICEIMQMDFLSLSERNLTFLINDFEKININERNLDKFDINFLNNLKYNKNIINYEKKINDHKLENAKNKEIIKDEKEKEERELEVFLNTTVKEKKQKIKAFLTNLPKYLFISNSQEESVNDILNDKRQEELFLLITKLSLHLFELMLKQRILDYEQLNLRIKSFQLLSQKV